MSGRIVFVDFKTVIDGALETSLSRSLESLNLRRCSSLASVVAVFFMDLADLYRWVALIIDFWSR